MCSVFVQTCLCVHLQLQTKLLCWISDTDIGDTHTHSLAHSHVSITYFHYSVLDCCKTSTLSYKHTIELYLSEQCVAVLLDHLAHMHSFWCIVSGKGWALCYKHTHEHVITHLHAQIR